MPGMPARTAGLPPLPEAPVLALYRKRSISSSCLRRVMAGELRRVMAGELRWVMDSITLPFTLGGAM